MAHLDTVSTSPVRADAGSAAGAAPRATDRMSARGLSWRALVVALLVAGAILAQTGPAASVADGSTLDVHSVGDTLTRAGNGWLLALSWFGGVIALVSTVVFPRRERFVQAIAPPNQLRATNHPFPAMVRVSPTAWTSSDEPSASVAAGPAWARIAPVTSSATTRARQANARADIRSAARRADSAPAPARPRAGDALAVSR